MSYFTLKEFECPCGCGLDNIDPDLVARLSVLRRALGVALVINSGCRCPVHNKHIGGAINSAHLPDVQGVCHAADVRITGGELRFNFVKLAVAQFGRVGVAKTFIHVDNHPTNPNPRLWLY